MYNTAWCNLWFTHALKEPRTLWISLSHNINVRSYVVRRACVCMEPCLYDVMSKTWENTNRLKKKTKLKEGTEWVIERERVRKRERERDSQVPCWQRLSCNLSDHGARKKLWSEIFSPVHLQLRLWCVKARVFVCAHFFHTVMWRT